jgi:sodium/bile acid cotransporter 7
MTRRGGTIGGMGWLRRLPVDRYISAILATVLLASLLPARGAGARVFDVLTSVAVGLLFFLYGARLSPRTAWAGARHWRLHLTILLATFALFPLLGLAARVLQPWLFTPQLYQGLLFLCAVPSTVQSSIAFTSIARGNVAAAICGATFSNLAGVLVTPVLVAATLHGSGGVRLSAGSVVDIVLQLLLPFAAGQLVRPWLGDRMDRHRRVIGLVDRGSILLVVYTAFSAGVAAGIWHRVSAGRMVAVIAVDALLLAAVLGTLLVITRALRFSREDRIAAVFCGSKKSLASGLPMAAVLFSGPSVGLIVLPLMLFHQIQLMVCAALARRFGRQAAAPDRPSGLHDLEGQLGGADHQPRVAVSERRTRVDRDLAVALQQDAERHPRLQPRQRRPETEVDAVAEREMRVGGAMDVEPVGLGEHPFVAVGGREPGDDDRTGRNCDLADDGVGGRPPRQSGEGRP